MMGVAVVTKHVIGNLSKMAKARYYKILYFNSCLVVMRWIILILKVGMAPVYRSLK